MNAAVPPHWLILGAMVLFLGAIDAHADSPARFRLPAPLEDDAPQTAVPVFGACAGHEGTDRSFGVMEWVSKRTWHVLGLPYERKDFEGPPARKLGRDGPWTVAEGTISDGGVPLRNQVITAEVEQLEEPLLVVLRSADAFGEVLIELDLLGGAGRARSVTVSRSMIGGACHSSPMPEQSSNRIIGTWEFPPLSPGPVELRIEALAENVDLSVGGEPLFSFVDPDPAGGKFGFGSVGRMRFRKAQQWELVTEREKRRRDECLRQMHEFCLEVDTHHDSDVLARNRVGMAEGGIAWTWPATGATATFVVEGGRVMGTVRAGLYGDDLLVSGPFPEVAVLGADGEVYRADADRSARVSGDGLALRLTLPLINDSRTKQAQAEVKIALTVQTVWFWTVSVSGVEPAEVAAFVGLGAEFVPATPEGPASLLNVLRIDGRDIVRHNAKAGFYLKAIEPEVSHLGVRDSSAGELAVVTTGPALRFATSILPAQPLNPIGFGSRMVHFIRYPEGPIQHWRRGPSFQEYPTNVDLARFAGEGTDAMVWHHTWISSDFRCREGFLVNHAEMARAMDETHRLGMKMIGYLGIVPGRSSLLGFEDVGSHGGRSGFGGYPKNWDLQDFTFYHVNGRYPEFLVWMTDYWCREYGLDGFYLDGGAFGHLSRGPTVGPLHPEDAGLSLDELRYRTYYRVKKVLELRGAGYGLEPWSGLDWMLNGFYDCMMIGESFQEAPPEKYRDADNALLTGCCIKMYGMRESSQNPYNIAMAAVNLSDIQVCSGNGAWGDVADTTETWDRVRPLWTLLDSIDWDEVVDARPWYAQELVSGDGFYAGNYTEPRRALVFLANKTEEPGAFEVRIDTAKLPPAPRGWTMRYCLGREGDVGPLGDGRFTVELPALHDGPIGIELTAVE